MGYTFKSTSITSMRETLCGYTVSNHTTELLAMMLNYTMLRHPNNDLAAVESFFVRVELTDSYLHLQYEVTGELSALNIPAKQTPCAVDGLWQHTCFEAFIAVNGEERYYEFNFSPSRAWAAYAFSAYRNPSAWTINKAPIIKCTQTKESLLMNVLIDVDDLPLKLEERSFQLGLTAVIETNEGELSYWALQHSEGVADFHQRNHFILSFNPNNP